MKYSGLDRTSGLRCWPDSRSRCTIGRKSASSRICRLSPSISDAKREIATATMTPPGRQTGQFPASCRLGDMLHVPLDRLDDVHLEATFDEGHRVDPGAASDVHDPTRRRRQVSIEQLQRPDVFEARSPIDEQALRLESECVVRSDVGIDHDASITHQRSSRCAISTVRVSRCAALLRAGWARCP